MKEYIKNWIVKNITGRELRDIHRFTIDKINDMTDAKSVLDIAPPHSINISDYIKQSYYSIGLTGKNLKLKHDLNKYPYPIKTGSYDIVNASHIIEHLNNPLGLLAEAFRISRKYIIISFPTVSRIHNDCPCHIHHWDMFLQYNKPNGKYMTRSMRDFVAKSDARSVMFVYKKVPEHKKQKCLKCIENSKIVGNEMKP